MVAAVRSVEDGKGLRETARLYNVPVETLRRRVTGSVSLECRPGPPTVLTGEEESRLARYIVDMADMGFGLGREDVMRVAYLIAEKSGRRHPFTNGMAGRNWFDGFRSRHPSLTLRSTQPLSYCRAVSANKETIRDFFGKLGAICARLNLLSKPMQIFNVDETGISIVHKPGKVVTQLGRKNVWSVTSAEKGKTHTVVSCVSASGYVIPPMMIYPRKRMTEKLQQEAVPGTLFECSENGWINQGLYLKWFKFFLANIPPARPVLLIEDGHASHITLEVIRLARENDVHLLCIPAHTTHLLQPLDVGVFKPLKSYFSKVCKRHLAANPGQVITTDILASLLGQAWPESVTPVNVMSGFKKSGIYPLNPGEISDRELAPSRAFVRSASESNPVDKSPTSEFTPQQEALYRTRFEEGYDLDDPEYSRWLRKKHPEVSDNLTCSVSTPESASGSTTISQSVASVSSVASHAPGSVSSSDVLSEVLLLPQPKPSKKKRKPGVNTKAVCLTDADVVKTLEAEAEEKLLKEQEQNTRRIERERKKKEREQKKLEAERKKKEKKCMREAKKQEAEKRAREQRRRQQTERQPKGTRTTRATARSGDLGLCGDFDKLVISSDTESEAECPKCGLVYGDDEATWICCDRCNTWYDVECAGVSENEIPDDYICEDCNMSVGDTV